jgi:hypothetical protein
VEQWSSGQWSSGAVERAGSGQWSEWAVGSGAVEQSTVQWSRSGAVEQCKTMSSGAVETNLVRAVERGTNGTNRRWKQSTWAMEQWSGRSEWAVEGSGAVEQ